MSIYNAPDFAATLAGVARLLDAGDLRIAVERTYPLADLGAAQTAVAEESFLGKLVVTI
jgi:NADPH:quinone reductase-like Zn-dependent oxidoreductase